jgi:hypothetical protein
LAFENDTKITSKYISNVKHYRATWSTYVMLLDMYKMVYMVSFWSGAMLSSYQSHSGSQDMNGNEVSEELVMGCKVEYKMLYPDRVLTMNETGDNGNHSNDKAYRGNKVICENDVLNLTQASSCTDTQWTTQAYTTIGGKAVLFVVNIIKKGSILDFNEYYGYEQEAEWIGEGEDACLKVMLPTQEQTQHRNMGLHH